MTNFKNEFKQHADRIQLTDAERSRIRARVLGEQVPSPFHFSFSYFTYSRGFAMAFSLILIVTTTTGTLYAAEGALPGDLLYSVKRNVAEPLTGVLAVSAEAESAWHARIATERLLEAETLAKAGALTEEVSADLADDFVRHAKNVAIASNDDGAGDTTLALDMQVSHTEIKKDDMRMDAKEKFRAAVVAKGASILEASAPDSTSGRTVSANFVLSVLTDQDTDASLESADTPHALTRMGKQSVPIAMTFATTAPTDAVENPAPEESLAELATHAKKAFQEASDDVREKGDNQARKDLSRLLPILVRAEAEMVTGRDEEARTHFTLVIDELEAQHTNETVEADGAPSSGEDEPGPVREDYNDLPDSNFFDR